MKLLHTSDLHLGKRLYEKDRSAAQAQMLDWIVSTVNKEIIDIVIIAGDVFDTANPPHKAQELYFRFLNELRKSNCKNIVVVGGNHDSPTFLNAPRQYLLNDGFFILGERPSEKSDNSSDAFLAKDEHGKPIAVICPIPYLREKDIQISDDILSREEEIVRSTANCYQKAVDAAIELRGNLEIPLISTGHLFAKGSKSESGEVELYIGSLGEVPSSVFPKEIDYLALGHIHRAQNVGGDPTRNYSGSPMPYNTGEAGQKKSVKIVEFNGREAKVDALEVPAFDQLAYIEGTLPEILEALEPLKNNQIPTLVEINHINEALPANLVSTIQDDVAGTKVEILRIRDASRANAYLSTNAEEDFIEEMDPVGVFDKRLELEENLSEEDITSLKNCYREVLKEIEENPQTN